MISFLLKEEQSFKVNAGFEQEAKAIQRLIEELFYKEQLEQGLHYEVIIKYTKEGVGLIVNEYSLTSDDINSKVFLFVNTMLKSEAKYLIRFDKQGRPINHIDVTLKNRANKKQVIKFSVA